MTPQIDPSAAPVVDARESSANLVAGIQRGDERAFRALFDAHYRKLFTFAWRMLGDEARSEEIVQDVLFGVWEQRANWAPDSVEAYLYAAVRNRALSVFKRLRVAGRHAAWVERQDSDVARSAAYAADIGPGAAELTSAIRRTLAVLPERCLQMFLLNRESGLSYAQIAATLGVSVKTVETQMGRALTVLRRELSDWLTP